MTTQDSPIHNNDKYSTHDRTRVLSSSLTVGQLTPVETIDYWHWVAGSSQLISRSEVMTVGAQHQAKMQNTILQSEIKKLEKIVPGLESEQENVNMVSFNYIHIERKMKSFSP